MPAVSDMRELSEKMQEILDGKVADHDVIDALVKGVKRIADQYVADREAQDRQRLMEQAEMNRRQADADFEGGL